MDRYFHNPPSTSTSNPDPETSSSLRPDPSASTPSLQKTLISLRLDPSSSTPTLQKTTKRQSRFKGETSDTPVTKKKKTTQTQLTLFRADDNSVVLTYEKPSQEITNRKCKHCDRFISCLKDTTSGLELDKCLSKWKVVQSKSLNKFYLLSRREEFGPVYSISKKALYRLSNQVFDDWFRDDLTQPCPTPKCVKDKMYKTFPFDD
ncbi:uncharacterized protein LOC131943876 [Physella acuta]|uniref:uncharacterized protein LOC131943876 n=1 Tax=Physella acuta TaxID=109671 RepID=UPI0027DC3801|nr:uncharacterized protein LOC131943876 [Physella acuta]